MASLVYAQEGEIAVLADLAVFGAVDGERGVACFGEGWGRGVVDGERGTLAAEPVADVVGVAVVYREWLVEIGRAEGRGRRDVQSATRTSLSKRSPRSDRNSG